MHGLDDVLAARAEPTGQRLFPTNSGGYKAAPTDETRTAPLPLAPERAVEQIKAWTSRGLIVELRGRPEGFILEVRTDDRMYEPNRIPDRPRFCYTTAVLPTPEQCVAQALEDLQR